MGIPIEVEDQLASEAFEEVLDAVFKWLYYGDDIDQMLSDVVNIELIDRSKITYDEKD